MADTWYCLIWGEELGPMSWDELLAMSRRGTLRPTDRVRRADEQDWRLAEEAEGLISAEDEGDETDFEVSHPAKPVNDETDFDISPPAKPASDETDFDISPPARPVNDEADFDLSPPAKPASDEEADFEISPPAKPAKAETQAADPPSPVPLPEPAPPTAPPAISPEPAPPPAPEVEPPATGWFAKLKRKPTLPATPDSEIVASAEPKPTSAPAAAKPTPPPPPPKEKKAAPPKEKAGLGDSSKKALLGLACLACLAVVGYLGYLGIVAVASMRSVNHDEILAGYDRLYEQAKKAQTDPSISSNPQMGLQFVAALTRLREPLQNAPPGSTEEKLNKAGTLLVELFSTAAVSPASDQGKARAQTDAAYQTLMSSIRGELGK